MIICGNNSVAVSPDFDEREPEMETCGRCDGDGDEAIGFDDDGEPIMGVCSKCKGTGLQERE